MHSRIILFFVALLVANTHASTSDCTPSQIHLSFGDSYYLASAPNNSELNSSQVNNNQVYLVWQSQSECQYFVTVNDTQSQNQISSKPYVLTQTIDNQTSTINLFSYTILLNNLSYGTSYSYAILDQSNVSLAGPFQFNLASPNITGTSNKIIVAGNLGSQQNDTMTLEAINKLLENETYAGVIEIGEVPAYLPNGTYAIQSNFTLPNFTATLPLFMAPGQGDMADNLTYFNFRIRNPLFDATHNQYFSFNLQGIHFVNINLDYYNLNTTNQSQVYSWLQNDLNAANSTTARESWPFVVVITSYPIYCTNDPESASQTTDCLSYFGLNDQLNDLFTNSNVDLVISGGLNAYQQLLSTDHGSSSKGSKNNTIINPNSTIYIIEGVGTSSQSEIRPGFGVIYPQNISGNLSLIYEHYDSDTGDIASSITLVKTSTQESTPGDNTSNPNDSSQNSGDNTSNPANSTNTTDSTSNPSDNSQNSTDTVNTNTTNNSQNSTTTISDDGLIGPTENPDASDPEEPESIVPRLIIPFIIILVIILVAIYWKRRKQDPEMESLTVEEYKSNKIYNKRSTNASISMVDLVL